MKKRALDDEVLDAVRAECGDDPALVWTRLAPNVPGHYWWRAGRRLPATVAFLRYDPRCVHLKRLIAYLPGRGESKPPADMGGSWCGPLEEPPTDAGRD